MSLTVPHLTEPIVRKSVGLQDMNQRR